MSEAENLLKTKYHVYEHSSGQPHVACEEYSLPAHLQEHVDFVTPSVHFDARLTGRTDDPVKKRSLEERAVPGLAHKIGQPGSGSLPKQRGSFGKNSIIKELYVLSHQCRDEMKS